MVTEEEPRAAEWRYEMLREAAENLIAVRGKKGMRAVASISDAIDQVQRVLQDDLTDGHPMPGGPF